MSSGTFAQSPIAHWKFDGNLADSSGNNLHATPTNITYAPGVNGQPNTAALFNGTSSFGSVPYQPIMNLTNFTITATVRVNGFYSNICQAEYLLAHGPEFSSQEYGLYMTDNLFDGNNCMAFDSTKFQFVSPSPSPSAPFWAAGTYVPSHEWLRFAITYDGDTFRSFYNGVPDVVVPYSHLISPGTDGIIIGREFDNPQYPYWFDGLMDDMKLYNIALSDSAVETEGCEKFITVQPPADLIIGPDTISYLIVGTNAGNASYQWQKLTAGSYQNLTSNATFSGVNNDTLTIHTPPTSLLSDSLRCIVTNEINCRDTSNVTYVDRFFDGIESVYNNPAFSFYPNPAKTTAVVNFKENISLLELLDLHGRVLQSIPVIAQSHEASINVQNLPAGIYMLSAKNKEGATIAIQKMMVE